MRAGPSRSWVKWQAWLPLILEIRICWPQPFPSSTSLWGALGSCSCHTALEMPCHSLVAVTLQCPRNDTGLKLVVLLREGGDTFPGPGKGQG